MKIEILKREEFDKWLEQSILEYQRELTLQNKIDSKIDFSIEFAKKDFCESLIDGYDTKNSHILKATENGEIKGYLWYFVRENDVFFISTLLVFPQFRNQGIASKMLNSLKCKTIMLHVFESNKGAIEFYQRRGFERINMEAEKGSIYMVKHIN